MDIHSVKVYYEKAGREASPPAVSFIKMLRES